jgi:hypothetical protein
VIGTTVAFLFLAETGVGMLLALWLLRRFALSFALQRLMAAIGGGLVACAVPLGMRALGAGAGAGDLLRAPFLSALAAIAACSGYVAALALRRADWGARLLAAGAVAGLISLAAAGQAVAAPSVGESLQLGAWLLSAALLLGTVLGAMVLGHWYLVDHKMPIEPLRAAAGWVLFAAAARAGVVAAPALAFWSARAAEDSPSPDSLGLGIFWAQRALFGLAGTMVLALMIRHTARLRATQAATGLLYIALIFAIIGEILSQYLFLKTDRLL